MKTLTACLISFLLIQCIACNKQPYEMSNVAGYVIGKETCHTDSSQDYWLVDLTYFSDTPHYGDSLLLNGTWYTNVVKATGLTKEVKSIGKKVSIDFRKITRNRIAATGCNIINP